MAHAEALRLVQRLPPDAGGWVGARPLSVRAGVLRRPFARAWAEVRGSTLLLYSVPPGGVAAVVAAEAAASAAAAAGRGSWWR